MSGDCDTECGALMDANQTIYELVKKFRDLKPILKQIEQSTNSRPHRVSLEDLHLNEQWFRVWKILGVQHSEGSPQ